MAVAAVHVLVFPWPLQGHINTFMPFSKALVDSGVHVTFLHTDHNLRRVRRTAAAPRLRYLSIPDGLPDDHPRSVGDIFTLMESMSTAGGAAYRALLLSLLSPGSGVGEFPPVTCVVADGIMLFAIDIAEELGVPALAFRTASANSFSAYLAVPRLLESGETPLPVDDPVHGVPGMEGFLRRRDLPRLAPAADGHPTESETAAGVHPMLLTMAKGIADCGKARALVLNTPASLEGSAVAHIAPHMRDVFAIGPLHAMSAVLGPAAAASLWREDDGCVAWLDGHADRSVVYVSLGSLTHISQHEFTEFLLGLLATGYPFLWVLRPDMVGAAEEAALRGAVGDGSKVRVVEWAPQQDVLRHRAVGCFLTHSGWNSTMESILEGVPMVCWPFFADQHINSRFVHAVWRAGLDMKDVCDRSTVTSMVTEVMESSEIRQSVQALAQRVKRDVATGGSSDAEFKRLVGFIAELSAAHRHQDQTPVITNGDVSHQG
ncbi:7-deoxyloganetic acid glucosyltransferase-like [Panicum miliaceum]|uniref:Glycosyltransferase n=1 Tax=Panicum miliaceum TaxID=4540 RepID=A0A3L6RBN4_PANMI|nr:7-deoxyloganetic acid glucosyltransferase-like [Panicum miliaceum]